MEKIHAVPAQGGDANPRRYFWSCGDVVTCITTMPWEAGTRHGSRSPTGRVGSQSEQGDRGLWEGTSWLQKMCFLSLSHVICRTPVGGAARETCQTLDSAELP